MAQVETPACSVTHNEEGQRQEEVVEDI